ncbi:MAG: SMC-Scp complex subunit ScpB [Gammaproteobacteria bacterium]
MDGKQLKYVIEAAMLAAGKPLSVDKLQSLFGVRDAPARQDIRAVIMELQADYAERGIELVEVGSGFRIQIKTTMTHQLEKLWEERPPRYSRALLETLSIIAYRQPVTRGEIEDIRGVAVSTNIVRTLLERNWVKVVGHRDVPGKPAMFGTTKEFLDYFGLKKLDDLPPLSELKDFEKLNIQLDLPDGEMPLAGTESEDEPGADADSLDDAGDDAVDSDDSLAFGPEEDAADDASLDGDNIASLDDARAASAREDEIFDAEDAEVAEQSATVVPLKQP